jgi:stage II sporulation protein D
MGYWSRGKSVAFLTLFCASHSWAGDTVAANRTLKVRDAQIQLPFELRILVRDLEPEQKLDISGTGLSDERGVEIGDEPIKCSASRKIAFLAPMIKKLEEALPIQAHWICRGLGYERPIVGAVRLHPKAGFLKANRDMFRNSLELVNIDGHLKVINDLGIEEYLAGLVNREIRSNYPREAVKAQVIAARSYALATAADRRRSGRFFDLHGTIQDQVYKGTTLEDSRSFRLVKETRGQVLFHRDDVLKAYYHASSGGYSELPQQVWGEHNSERDALAYLARPSLPDAQLADSKWSILISPKMGLQWPGIGLIADLKVLERSTGRRVQKIEIVGSDGSETLTGNDFRRKLGVNWVRSAYFYIRRVNTGWLLEGQGHGHGVGLSQLGAKAMAKEGKSTEEILNFYYPYADVRQLKLDEEGPSITIGTR